MRTGPGVLLYAHGYSKSNYTSCWFSIWAESRARVDEVIARLEQIAGDARMLEQSFTLDWRFTDSNGGLRNSEFQELADGVRPHFLANGV
jgi:hypothetical protein